MPNQPVALGNTGEGSVLVPLNVVQSNFVLYVLVTVSNIILLGFPRIVIVAVIVSVDPCRPSKF